MNRQPFPKESSNLQDRAYDPATQTLEVGFKNGSDYTYSSVPQSVADELDKAESIGSYFHSRIRNAKDDKGNFLYPFHKVEKDSE